MSLEVLLVISAAVLGTTGVGCLLYYRHQLRGMAEVLRRCREEEPGSELLKDTVESKLEAQLRRQLHQSALHKEQADRERESLASLLSDLSHQLKTPLANIVMDAELLQEEELSETEMRVFAGRIGVQAGKMQWLIAELVKASRLEQGMMQIRPSQQFIRPTLAASVSAVYSQAQAKQIQIEFDEFADCLLYHNRKWTAEAIANLLENAVKYSPVGAVVQIGLRRFELYTQICIQDQGCGIKPEEYNLVFRRFYRGEDAAETEGSGLGLYLAQVILNQQKGYITCQANPEGGSRFFVFLLNQEPGD